MMHLLYVTVLIQLSCWKQELVSQLMRLATYMGYQYKVRPEGLPQNWLLVYPIARWVSPQ